MRKALRFQTLYADLIKEFKEKVCGFVHKPYIRGVNKTMHKSNNKKTIIMANVHPRVNLTKAINTLGYTVELITIQGNVYFKVFSNEGDICGYTPYRNFTFEYVLPIIVGDIKSRAVLQEREGTKSYLRSVIDCM